MKTLSEKELRELDAWIAEHVCDFAWVPRNPGQGSARWLAPNDEWEKYLPEYVERGIYQEDGVYPKCVPYYTLDPAAAMQVLEKCVNELCEQDQEETVSVGMEVPYFVVEKTNASKSMRVEAATLPLAICLFAKQLFSK